MKSYEQIRDNITNGEYHNNLEYPRVRYKENHVFDEDKSVKWNREERIRQTEKIEQKREDYRKEGQKREAQFKTDIKEYLDNNYDLKNSKEIIEKISSKAYTEGHSGGYFEILNYALDLADFVEDILKINNDIKQDK